MTNNGNWNCILGCKFRGGDINLDLLIKEDNFKRTYLNQFYIIGQLKYEYIIYILKCNNTYIIILDVKKQFHTRTIYLTKQTVHHILYLEFRENTSVLVTNETLEKNNFIQANHSLLLKTYSYTFSVKGLDFYRIKSIRKV